MKIFVDLGVSRHITEVLRTIVVLDISRVAADVGSTKTLLIPALAHRSLIERRKVSDVVLDIRQVRGRVQIV
jgi:hypothetical protein